MKKLSLTAAPHINSGVSTHNIMLDVVIAMIPASIAAIVFFGIKALLLILTCVASAVAAEAIFNLCVKKKQTVGDFSATVTGLLLALNLSTNVELWQAALGSVFAIVVVKGFFGGLGKNIVNPAIAARVLMLLTFASVAGGGRIVCVGTTSCRTLESLVNEDGTFCASSKWTEIFIYPGYKFKAMDALITNFHLPESTLVMLVSAFAGRESVLHAYEEAVKERYRFFSFGDAMFIG